MMTGIEKAKALCVGFYIDNPVGNNAFSFDQRQCKKIFVAPLKQGDLRDLQEGKEIAFSEIADGNEINCRGLENFIYWPHQGKHIFIFDNHNHAFFFWMQGLKEGWLSRGQTLVHIDQHTDMREPEKYLETPLEKISLEEAFHYANHVLNVGNFIKPALKLDLFSELKMINNREALDKKIEGEFVLDLDMDFFIDEQEQEAKLIKVRSFIGQSKFITIATSPFFIPQDKSIKLLKSLFEYETQAKC